MGTSDAMAEPPARLIGYRPALDGIRAFAILGVLASHSRLGVWHAGWIGVDVFFVLSGFLITTLLLEEHDRYGRVDLRAFFIRRGFRLLPALALLLAVLSLWVLTHRPSLPRPDETIDGIPAAAFYLSSWVMAFGAELGALSHTWSLSVEEHFYAVWPLLFLVAVRVRHRRVVAFAALYGAAVVYRLAFVAMGATWDRVFYGPDTRAEQLLIGCLLAAIVADVAGKWRDGSAVQVVGLVSGIALAILASVFRGYGYLWVGMSATGLLSAGVIAAVYLQPERRSARLLAAPPLVWIGRRSYAMYLWYWPVFLVFAQAGVPAGWTRFVLEFPVITGLAALSYRFLERPLIRIGRERGRVRPAVAVSTAGGP